MATWGAKSHASHAMLRAQTEPFFGHDRRHLEKRDSLQTTMRVQADETIHNILVADVGEWISRTLELDPEITHEDIWDRLKDGWLLCNLVIRICGDPMPKLKSNRMCTKNLMFCRENIGKFIKMVGPYIVDRIVLFEPDDLILRRNEKQVITCLLQLSKNFFKQGILKMEDLPEFAQAELEIEQEEFERSNSPEGTIDTLIDAGSFREVYDREPGEDDSDEEESEEEEVLAGSVVELEQNGAGAEVAEDTRNRTVSFADQEKDEVLPEIKPPSRKKLGKRRKSWRFIPKSDSHVDCKLADFINGSGIGMHMPVKRIKPGTYVFGSSKKTTYVRELRNILMVRVGGGWMKLEDWIIKYMPNLEKNVHTFREIKSHVPGHRMKEIKKTRLLEKHHQKKVLRQAESTPLFRMDKKASDSNVAMKSKHDPLKLDGMQKSASDSSIEIRGSDISVKIDDLDADRTRSKSPERGHTSSSRKELVPKSRRHQRSKSPRRGKSPRGKSPMGRSSGRMPSKSPHKNDPTKEERSEPLPAKNKHKKMKRAATSTKGFRLGAKKDNRMLKRSRSGEIPHIHDHHCNHHHSRSKSPNPERNEMRERMLERANKRINKLKPDRKGHSRSRSRDRHFDHKRRSPHGSRSPNPASSETLDSPKGNPSMKKSKSALGAPKSNPSMKKTKSANIPRTGSRGGFKLGDRQGASSPGATTPNKRLLIRVASKKDDKLGASTVVVSEPNFRMAVSHAQSREGSEENSMEVLEETLSY